MNEQLTNLYKAHWTTLLSNAAVLNNKNSKLQPSYPLLIKVNEKYENAKIKVMVVGQETDKWHGLLVKNNLSIDDLMNCYLRYFQNVLIGKHKEINRRAFWNRKNFKYFKGRLEREFGKENIGFVWSNLSKIGKNSRGKVTEEINHLETESFSVHLQEIEILKPDIIIFNTGNNRDHLLKERFEVNLLYAGYSTSKKEIAQVLFPEQYHHIISYRTFHPNARIHGKTRKDRNRYIADQIIKNFNNLNK
ncbi:hypothetical protein [Litorilituus lipolyticus]|uniref:Uracil-DNA glycosylase-like domain-containing protein n=1 Tax=Litorilituus lipolyticus TaxID=2491017 RepID=A0A502KW62_9GAMM|nr:hypothetical protein [Litorilituus lipolyticus]TPH15862.1 hypothetical protein EPA86_07795 [Litorilituus lipolyticus]